MCLHFQIILAILHLGISKSEGLKFFLLFLLSLYLHEHLGFNLKETIFYIY